MLATKLVKAADDKQLVKTIARYGRVDLCVSMSLAVRHEALMDRAGCEARRRSSQ